eukprot:TRINITY_DN58_c0_g1_i5.p1 TRINITY_DN58_c0_g1~~TRINITY_DN58_c0_g1_i5.p1  ORF type:complete len:866 (-),score=234.03 TRINITY_DN58_c0_g1_i5:144-2741(-)
MSGVSVDIAVTADGRTFPACYLQWAEQLEADLKCDYDYAFEVVRDKQNLGNASEFLRKHPKKGGLFGAFKKKNKTRSFPKLSDEGVKIVKSNEQSPTLGQDAKSPQSAKKSPEKAKPSEMPRKALPPNPEPVALVHHDDFVMVEDDEELKLGEDAPVAPVAALPTPKKTPKSYKSAVNSSGAVQVGPILLVEDEHRVESVSVASKGPVIVEQSPQRVPSVSSQRIVSPNSKKDVLAQRVKLASPEKMKLVPESPAKSLPAPQVSKPTPPVSKPRTPKQAPPQSNSLSDMPPQVKNISPVKEAPKVASPPKRMPEINPSFEPEMQGLNIPQSPQEEPPVPNDSQRSESPAVKKSYAQALAVETPDAMRAQSPFRRPTPMDFAQEDEKVMIQEKVLYRSGDKVEVRRSNGQWVEGTILQVAGKIVVVEYVDGQLKFQKKMPTKSQHLAPFGTNIIPAPVQKPTETKFDDEEDPDLDQPVDEYENSFQVVKHGKLRAQSPKLTVRPVESPKTQFINTMTSAKSDLTESPTDKKQRKKGSHVRKTSIESNRSNRSDRHRDSMVLKGSEFGQSVYSGNLLPDHRPTPDYQVGDYVQIKCSDGHWYRGKLLDVGENAVLVEYRRKKNKFQKRLPIRSKYLRLADDDDVSSVHSAASAKSSQNKHVALKYLVGPEKELKEKKGDKKKMSKTLEVPASVRREKRGTRSGRNQDDDRSVVSRRDRETSTMRKSADELPEVDSREHVEILRSDQMWYEGRVVKSGKQACLVEYVVDGKKYQKTLPLQSPSLAPYGTHIFAAEVGDDVEYLTTSKDWVKAQICEVQDPFYIILYREGENLVEKRIPRNSPNLAKYGLHTKASRHNDVSSRKAEKIR